MSLTDRYVSATGSDTYANSTSASTPMSLTTALANAAAGDRINIQTGAYSRTSSDGTTNSGTSASPIVFRGVDAGWNPISPRRANGNGALATSGLPLLSYATSTALLASKSYLVFDSFSITGNVGGSGVIALGTGCAVLNCSIVNANGNAISLGQDSVAVNCDATSTSGSGVSLGGNNTRVFSCRISAPTCVNAGFSGFFHTVAFCTFTGGTGVSAAANAGVTVVNCTGYGLTSAFASLPNASVTHPMLILNCVGTDGAMFCNNLFSATSVNPAIRVNNRTRDNTSADTGFGDWPVYGAITTDTGGPETDYVNASGGDFNLIASSPAKAAGILAYLDCGALQRQEAGRSGRRAIP